MIVCSIVALVFLVWWSKTLQKTVISCFNKLPKTYSRSLLERTERHIFVQAAATPRDLQIQISGGTFSDKNNK